MTATPPLALGLVGLGRMGGNMARRLARAGVRVVGYDATPGASTVLAAEGVVTAVESLAALVAALPAPRVVWVMVPAGAATQATIDELAPLLAPGDTIVDGGNANYKDSQRRGARLAARGLDFVDCGVSGGVWGLDNGYALMGEPVQASGEVTVYFYDPDQRLMRQGLIDLPFGGTSMDGASRRIYEISKSRFVYRRASPSELDQPIALRDTKVMVMTDAKGQPAAGECLVDYYIDARGDVRAPRVVSSDNDTVALSALLTLQNTHYAPVTRNGIPTYVKVRQPMSYAPSAETASK